MREFRLIVTCALLALAMSAAAFGQTPAASPAPAAAAAQTDRSITPNRVFGEVVALDGATRRITIRTDGGATVTAELNDATTYLRTQPGATNLENATPATLSDIRIGDRVIARGRVADDRASVVTRQLILMTRADIERRDERSRAEWRQRGIVGTITAINPATKEITVQLRGGMPAGPPGAMGAAPPAPQTITVEGSATSARFRRYASDSVRFVDARPSTFAEIKVGDQLRALGNRSADGARYTPEEIVTGSFRTVTGTVVSVNAQANEITINDQQTQRQVVISVKQDSLLRRLPEQFAQFARMAAARGQGGGPGGGPGGGERPAGGGERRGGPGGPGGARAEGEGRPGGGPGGGRRMMGGGSFDLQEMLERQPPITVAELNAGDMIVVSTTSGASDQRITAIALVAGIEPLIQLQQARQRSGAPRPAGDDSLGLPGGLDLGIGLP